MQIAALSEREALDGAGTFNVAKLKFQDRPAFRYDRSTPVPVLTQAPTSYHISPSKALKSTTYYRVDGGLCRTLPSHLFDLGEQ